MAGIDLEDGRYRSAPTVSTRTHADSRLHWSATPTPSSPAVAGQCVSRERTAHQSNYGISPLRTSPSPSRISSADARAERADIRDQLTRSWLRSGDSRRRVGARQRALCEQCGQDGTNCVITRCVHCVRCVHAVHARFSHGSRGQLMGLGFVSSDESRAHPSRSGRLLGSDTRSVRSAVASPSVVPNFGVVGQRR